MEPQRETTTTGAAAPREGLGERVREAGGRLRDLVEERPLVAGAVTMALGLLGGLALPATRREHELLGGPRDQLLGEAKQRVRRTVESGKQAVRAAVEEVEQAVQGDDE